MTVERQVSGKVVAAIVIIFFIVLIWARMRPAAGLQSSLLEPSKIDSILIERSDGPIKLISTAEISEITTALKQLAPVDPANPRLHRGLARLSFFTKSGQQSVSILFTNYDGVLLEAGESYYRGSSLDSLVSKYSSVLSPG